MIPTQLQDAERIYGIAAIKVPGLGNNLANISAENAEITIDPTLTGIWYQLREEKMVVPMHKGLIYVPISQVYGIAFNEHPIKPPNNEKITEKT